MKLLSFFLAGGLVPALAQTTLTTVPTSEIPGPTVLSSAPAASCTSSLKCNAPGCFGANNQTTKDSISYGSCTAGDCAGTLCTSACPSTPVTCDDPQCFGGSQGLCLVGANAGCACKPVICPSSQPQCSDATCEGVSIPDQSHGVCNALQTLDCPCTNSCPSTTPNCGDDKCKGINNPSGGDSTCISGEYAGCKCQSLCTAGHLAGLCDTIENCDPVNIPDGDGVCTSGNFAGCHCQSNCASEPGSCYDAGCNGLYINGTDKAFCTSGDHAGCECSSQCRLGNGEPLCTENHCAGVNFVCTSLDHWGCPCSGANAAKRDVSAAHALRRRALTPGEISVAAFYTCTPLPWQDQTVGTEIYSSAQVVAAVRAGYNVIIERHLGIHGSNSVYYPRPFYVNDEANFRIPNNANTNDLFEFPLGNFDPLGGTAFTTGDDPGPDRVIFEGLTGEFVGVFTHRGEDTDQLNQGQLNRFHQANGHDHTVDEDETYLQFPPPTRMGPAPWIMQGLGGGSGFNG